MKVYENLAVKSYNKFLLRILVEPKKLQADFCRHNAHHVARAASLGHISSKTNDGTFGNLWRVTVAGIYHLADSRFFNIVKQ